MSFSLGPGEDILMLILKHRYTSIMVAFLIILAFLSPISVSGTTCRPDETDQCQESMFTLSTCDRGIIISSCDCRPGYFPIHTGCAKRIKTPTLRIDGRRSLEVIGGTKLTFYSSFETDIDGIEPVYHSLMKNGQIFDTNREYFGSSYFEVHFYSEDDAGVYSCKITLKESESNYVDSEESNQIQITVLSRGSTTSTKPILDVGNIPSYAQVGERLYPGCTNVPYGATFKYEVDNGEPPTRSLVYSSSHQNHSVRCVIDPVPGITFTNPHSEWAPMPKLKTDSPTTTTSTTQSSSLFDSKWSRVGLLISVDQIFARSNYTFPAGYDFRCLVVVCTGIIDSPSNSYGLYDLEVNYTFYESYENTEHVTETSREDYYLVRYGVHHIYCTAEYENWKARSNTITITFIENYVVRPVLAASTGTKLLEGSRLVLTCGEPQNVKYIWRISVGESETVIPLQRDYMIQVGNFTEKDAGEYRCYVSRDDYEYCEPSNSVTVTMVQNISQPVIERLDDGDTFVEGQDYQLECHTDSATPGMTYSWKLDYRDLETTGKVYTISNASFSNHGGLYRCTAFFNGKVSRHSDSFLVSVKDSSSNPAMTSTPVMKRLDTEECHNDSTQLPMPHLHAILGTTCAVLYMMDTLRPAMIFW